MFLSVEKKTEVILKNMKEKLVELDAKSRPKHLTPQLGIRDSEKWSKSPHTSGNYSHSQKVHDPTSSLLGDI